MFFAQQYTHAPQQAFVPVVSPSLGRHAIAEHTTQIGGVAVFKGGQQITRANFHERWDTWPGELVIRNVVVANSRSANTTPDGYPLDFSPIMESIAQRHQGRKHFASLEHIRATDPDKKYGRRVRDRIGAWENGRVEMAINEQFGAARPRVLADLFLNEEYVEARQLARYAISAPAAVMSSIEIAEGGWSGRAIEESDRRMEVLSFHPKAMSDTSLVCDGGNTFAINETRNSMNFGQTNNGQFGQQPAPSQFAQAPQQPAFQGYQPAMQPVQPIVQPVYMQPSPINECGSGGCGTGAASAPAGDDVAMLKAKNAQLELQNQQLQQQLAKLANDVEESNRRQYIDDRAKQLNVSIEESTRTNWVAHKYNQAAIDTELGNLARLQQGNGFGANPPAGGQQFGQSQPGFSTIPDFTHLG